MLERTMTFMGLSLGLPLPCLLSFPLKDCLKSNPSTNLHNLLRISHRKNFRKWGSKSVFFRIKPWVQDWQELWNSLGKILFLTSKKKLEEQMIRQSVTIIQTIELSSNIVISRENLWNQNKPSDISAQHSMVRVQVRIKFKNERESSYNKWKQNKD